MLGAAAFLFGDLAGFFPGMPPFYRVAAVVLAGIFVVDLVAIAFELRRLARKRRKLAPRPITAIQAFVAFAGAAAFILGACLFLAAPPELPRAEADTMPEMPVVADVSPKHPAANQAAAIAAALRRAGPQTIRIIEGGDDPGAAVDLPKWRAILKSAGWTSEDGGQVPVLNPPGGVVVAIGMRPELQAGMDVKPEDLPVKARALLSALYAQGIPVELRMTQLFMLRDDAILIVCGRSLPDSPRS